MKKCETFGCTNPGVQLLMIAPATKVWLCAECVEENEEETNKEATTERDIRPAA